MKSYNQFCSVARALDVVGDRWALLVVRELLLGPRRYSDLLEGLPGVGTNVLATRLRELEASGIVERRRLPAPTPVTVYDLTEDGRELRTVINALAGWGVRRLDSPTDDDALAPRWLAGSISAALPADKFDDNTSYELRIEDSPFVFEVRGGVVLARHGEARDAIATLSGTMEEFFRAAKGDRSKARRIKLEGNRNAGEKLVEVVTGCLSSAAP